MIDSSQVQRALTWRLDGPDSASARPCEASNAPGSHLCKGGEGKRSQFCYPTETHWDKIRERVDQRARVGFCACPQIFPKAQGEVSCNSSKSLVSCREGSGRCAVTVVNVLSS